MKTVVIALSLAVFLLLCGCSRQSQWGQNPIIQLQAEKVVIGNMQIGQPLAKDALQKSAKLPELESLQISPVAESASLRLNGQQPLAEESLVIEKNNHPPPPPPNASAVPDLLEEVLPQDKPAQPVPAPPETKPKPPQKTQDSIAPELPAKEPATQEGGQRSRLKFGEKIYALGGQVAEMGERLEQGAAKAEQAVADGWFGFIDKMNDYRYGMNDWWMRRRGLNPVTMR